MHDCKETLVISAVQIDPTSNRQVDLEFLKVSIIKENGNPLRHDDRILPWRASGCKILKSEVSLRSDGTLTFRCTISALTSKQEPVPYMDSAVAIDCSDGLSNQLEGLFNEMKFSDVSFNIGGRQFPAHKSILAAKSEVFEAMFQHPTKENFTNRIEIEDIEPDVFHELLRFIYTGRLSRKTMETLAVRLLIAADKYLLDDLKVKCENYLICQMSPANCLEILSNEHLPDSAKSELKELATHFLSLNEGKGPEMTD
jgi:speckle-type POZ protein